MRYMTFNNSCTFAGVANLLEDFNIEIEDYDLAIKCKVPYIFSYNEETGSYITGAMIQEAEYFNYGLFKYGFRFVENKVALTRVPEYLAGLKSRAMIGLKMGSGKHAVIYSGIEDGHYVFLNNKREDSEEPSMFVFNRDELISRLDDQDSCSIARVCANKGVKEVTDEIDFEVDVAVEALVRESIEMSLERIEAFRNVTLELMQMEQTPEQLLISRERVFRALFLDAYSMMEILGEHQLVQALSQLRNSYMGALRLNQPVVLAHYVDLSAFDAAITKYKEVIQNAKI